MLDLAQESSERELSLLATRDEGVQELRMRIEELEQALRTRELELEMKEAELQTLARQVRLFSLNSFPLLLPPPPLPPPCLCLCPFTSSKMQIIARENNCDF
jgi:hypothetical protein